MQTIARGLVSAISPPDGPTHLQTMLVRALTKSMTGFSVDRRAAAEPIDAPRFAQQLARRDELFRDRISASGPAASRTASSPWFDDGR